ncbi:MAG: monovalent cation/H+ antiporter complex subunit F [Bacillota bacterium]|nr:MAG: Na(+)/H(+) antiporter subunit F [Bacillota bacterium]
MAAVMLLALLGLSAALVLTAYRVVVGPTAADRVAALDNLTSVLIGLLVVGSMYLQEPHYLDYALVIAVLGFATTVALGKYLEGGRLFERDGG